MQEELRNPDVLHAATTLLSSTLLIALNPEDDNMLLVAQATTEAGLERIAQEFAGEDVEDLLILLASLCAGVLMELADEPREYFGGLIAALYDDFGVEPLVPESPNNIKLNINFN